MGGDGACGGVGGRGWGWVDWGVSGCIYDDNFYWDYKYIGI